MHLLRYTGNVSKEEFKRRVGAQSFWYHSYYFDNRFQVRGHYNIGADILDYGFPKDMAGMKILDIGTGSGWFAIYFEQQGAEVTTVDARGYSDFDVYGRYAYPTPLDEQREPDQIDDEGGPLYYSPVSGGFWIMKDILGSDVRFRNARVYNISPDLFGRETFDLVFMGAILLHLRDPIGALMAARSVCRDQLIATTPVCVDAAEENALPRQYLPYTAIDKISWWLPNLACFHHWFLAAGFREVNVERELTLRSDIEHRDEEGRIINASQILRVGCASI